MSPHAHPSTTRPAARRLLFLCSAALAMTLAMTLAGACDRSPGANVDADPDEDRDGFPASVDCDDHNRYVYPGAPERCDGIDNDCDGIIDEGWDQDGDGWTTCAGDCRDNDPTSHPGATEVLDGVDNDCDGRIDNVSSSYDHDGDGYSVDQGDCNDDPGNGGALIGPGAVEVQFDREGNPDGVDDDCDGIIDEALPPCPSGGDPDDPWSYVNAIGACHFATSAWWNQGASINPLSRGIFASYGDAYVARAGEDFMVLSTGIAADSYDPRYVAPQQGTEFTNRVQHPSPQGPIGCSSWDPPWVNDYTEVVMRLVVPTNATAFSFDFNFMSTEFPEWVCTEFDDTFLAILESAAFTGNISFDSLGNRVSINVGFFTVCDPVMSPNCTGNEDLMGTGYELEGGGTGWLTTTAPVIPGEKITLRFMIFDEGDRRLDSAVLIDNFRWEIDVFVCPDGSPPPCTIGRSIP
jgi:hypothetical protein